MELEHQRHIDLALVGQCGTHQRGGDEAGVLADEVGADEGGGHHHEHGRDRLARNRPLRLLQQDPQDRGAERADRGADQDAHEHLPRAPELSAGASREHRMEDDDAEQGADRIDEHPLPHQQGAHPWRRADEPEQRQHDRRTRDDEDGADEQRHEIAEAIEEQGRRGPDAGPRHQDPDGDEKADRPAYVVPDLPHREAQAGLEQDQPHGKGYEWLVERAEQRVRVDVVGGDPGQESDGQEHHDGRQPETPGQQLRADRKHDHQPETEQHVVGRHVGPSSSRSAGASSSKPGDRAQITRFGG